MIGKSNDRRAINQGCKANEKLACEAGQLGFGNHSGVIAAGAFFVRVFDGVSIVAAALPGIAILLESRVMKTANTETTRKLAEKELARLVEENFGRVPRDPWTDAVLDLRDKAGITAPTICTDTAAHSKSLQPSRNQPKRGDAVTDVREHSYGDKTVVVDHGYHWQPMTSCPVSAKCQLLGAGGVAVYSSWDGKDAFWQGWAPLPKRSPVER